MSQRNGPSNRHQQVNIPRTPVPGPSASSQTTMAGSFPEEGLADAPAPPPVASGSSDGAARQVVLDLVRQEFFKKVWQCNTIGELVRVIPVPAQPSSKNVLDGVYQACQKQGAAVALLQLWRDVLRANTLREFEKVAQLNSIRAPVVQVCKEALLGPEDGGLSSLNFDDTVKAAKRSALQKMIEIKALEVQNLQGYVQPNAVSRRLQVAWEEVFANNAASLTPEHADLLSENAVIERVARVATSIGESSYKRVKLAKEKRVEVRKDADVEMTDASGAKGKKHLAAVVEEVLKRREQSRKDRALSGKGRRRSGVSKNKTSNQKQTKKKNRGQPRKSKKQNKGPGATRRERRSTLPKRV